MSLQAIYAAALLGTAVSPACFRRVSRVPQNGFIGGVQAFFSPFVGEETPYGHVCDRFPVGCSVTGGTDVPDDAGWVSRGPHQRG